LAEQCAPELQAARSTNVMKRVFATALIFLTWVTVFVVLFWFVSFCFEHKKAWIVVAVFAAVMGVYCWDMAGRVVKKGK